jgi:hypothetical protein
MMTTMSENDTFFVPLYFIALKIVNCMTVYFCAKIAESVIFSADSAKVEKFRVPKRK